MKSYYALTVGVFLTLPGLLQAEEWIVDGDGSGDFTTIQGAIDEAASGDRITVYPGTYPEGLDFMGKALELASSDGPEVTIVDAEGGGPALQLVSGETQGTSITGFTFTGGSGALNLEGDTFGGGILIEGSEATLAELILRDNGADYGGAVAIIDGAADLQDVTLHGNSAGYGGALYSRGSAVSLSRGVIFDNTAAYGGAIRLYDGVISLGGSIIYDNTTTASDSGTVALRYLQGGSEVTHLTLFENDSGLRGAGIQVYASDVAVVNNIVAGDLQGAGIGLTAQTNDALLAYNNGFLNPGGAILSDGEELSGEGGNISADPTFLAAEGDEPVFMLFPGSPCINTGDPDRLDLDGSRSDMGAFGGTEGFVPNWDDSDADGMPDIWETYYGLDPAVDDGAGDADEDGLTNLEEFALSLDPTNSDTDGDGIADGAEVDGGLDPSDPSDNIPLADAGSDWSIGRGSYITLDATASTDPNGDDLQYEWTLLAAPGQSALNGQTLPGNALTEVLVDIRGDYLFELRVSDGRAWSEPAQVRAVVHGVRWVPYGYDTIQEAIDAARDTDEIRVEPGTYHETLDYNGKAITVTSTAGPEETILDVSGQDYGVQFNSSEGLGSKLIGFTITGYSTSSSYRAAVRISSAGATISDCIFRDNRSSRYSAIYVDYGELTLTDSLFMGNESYGSSGAVVYAYRSDVTILRNAFVQNLDSSAYAPLYIGYGDGFVANNLFQENVGSRAGGVYAYYGRVTMTQNVFAESKSSYGSGNYADLYFSNSGTIEVSNSIFAGSTEADLAVMVHYSYGSFTHNLLNEDGYREELFVGNNYMTFDELLYGDPGFEAWSPDGDPSNDNLTLAGGSAAIDAGDPLTVDADGTRADLGLYGGVNSALMDTDGDGAPDFWERRYLLDPERFDAHFDMDGDGLSNAEEFAAGSSPLVTDSDYDGVGDWEEVAGGFDPGDPSDQRPVAVAGADFGSSVGLVVTLDGSGSIDPNGDALTYTWSLIDVPEESALTADDLGELGSSMLTFIPDVRGFYEFGLVVSDGKVTSPLDTVMVTALGTLLVPEDFETIQSAVDESLPGEPVRIAGGVWEESVIINKPVDIGALDEASVVVITPPEGRSAFRIYDVDEGVVFLRALTLASGTGTYAGAGDYYGGAIYAVDSRVEGEGLSFLGNSADWGGAVTALGGELTLRDVHFDGNIARKGGGAIFLGAGDHSVTRGVFWSNEGPAGGAIHHRGDGLHLEASIFQNNQGVEAGSAGALSLEGPGVVQNCTFLENSGTIAADVSLWDPEVTINSSIFGGGDGVAIFGYVSIPLTAFTYNNFIGYGATVGGSAPNPINHGGNLAQRPRFVANPLGSTPVAHDLHLRPSSPCIDAGDPQGELNDLDGSANDMGAYGGPEALP